MVCDKLPFTAGKSREAIEFTIAGGAVRYSRVVRFRGIVSLPREEESGTLSDQNISLQGACIIKRPLRGCLPRDRKQP